MINFCVCLNKFSAKCAGFCYTFYNSGKRLIISFNNKFKINNISKKYKIYG